MATEASMVDDVAAKSAVDLVELAPLGAHRLDDKLSAGPPRSAFAEFSRTQILRKFWRLYLFGLGVSLAGMYTGYTLTAPGNIVANKGFIQQFGTVRDPATGDLALNASYLSLWSGFNFVAQIASQILSPLSGDRFGRKLNMYLFTGSMLVAIILEIVAKDWKAYLGSKIMAGVSCGFLGTTIMTYLSEMAIPQMRGSLLATFSLAFALGQLFCAIGLQVLQESAPLAFRRIFYSEFVILGVWIVPLLLLPESPAWLAGKGKHAQGEKALKWLVGNVEGYDVSHEFKVIVAEVEESKALVAKKLSSDWRLIFRGVNLKRSIIATLPFTFTVFVGVPFVYGQTTYFFQTAGLENAFLASLIISIISIVGIITSFFLVEKLGRRTLVLWGSAGCIVCDIAIGAMGLKPINSGLAAGLITMASLWVFLYSISLSPIGWMMLVEVSTPALRAKTAAFATVIQSFANVLFNYTVPLMLSDQYAGWGTKVGFFFGGLSVLYWIPCYYLVPETKDRSYAALDELFERGISPRHFAKTKTEVETVQTQPDASSKSAA